MNLWVSNSGSTSQSIMIMRAIGGLRGTVLQTLIGDDMNGSLAMAFDGERVLVCNLGGHTVSLFRASDFAALGSLSTGDNSSPSAACSDGVNFWIVRSGLDDIVRF
jgi:hypothetical protein